MEIGYVPDSCTTNQIEIFYKSQSEFESQLCWFQDIQLGKKGSNLASSRLEAMKDEILIDELITLNRNQIQLFYMKTINFSYVQKFRYTITNLFFIVYTIIIVYTEAISCVVNLLQLILFVCCPENFKIPNFKKYYLFKISNVSKFQKKLSKQIILINQDMYF